MDDFVKIAWHGLHFGEEPPLVGEKGAGPSAKLGAGAIFFTGCNLRCVYCQNYQISQENLGKKYSPEELAGMMLALERAGAANIDLVSPTIWARAIKPAITMARKQGLKLPIVWNSNAYESVEIIKSMSGLADIYLPDFKYADDDLALKYSGVKNYVKIARQAIGEMLNQVGDLVLAERGLAKQGLIVRHLILPGCVENSLRVLDLIKEIGGNIRVSLMSQYEPVYKAKAFSEINRRLKAEEFEKVFDYMVELGLDRGWTQGLNSQTALLPDFTRKNPFAQPQ